SSAGSATSKACRPRRGSSWPSPRRWPSSCTACRDRLPRRPEAKEAAMRCPEVGPLLLDLAERRLPAARAQLVLAHVSDCAPCAADLTILREAAAGGPAALGRRAVTDL